MLGLYIPILLLQAFCFYHAYRNNVEQRWYWLIAFFPVGGCIIYLVHHFNNRATIDSITETVKVVVNSNYKIEQLEKAMRFSDNLTNKLNLADAYAEIGRYPDAIVLYKDCLQGFMSDDVPLQMKLLQAYFLNKDYDATIDCGNKLEADKSFKNSEERVAYAWALDLAGKGTLAEKVFMDMDKTFTNYHHRMEYCKFLIKADKISLARETLSTLMNEFEHMNGPERKLKRDTFREIKDLHGNLVRA